MANKVHGAGMMERPIALDERSVPRVNAPAGQPATVHRCRPMQLAAAAAITYSRAGLRFALPPQLMDFLFTLTRWIDAVNDRLGVIAKYAVVASCLISAGNA